MNTIRISLLITALFTQKVLAQQKTTAETVALVSAITYQTALARADTALAKSLLNEKLLKGQVGEAIRDQTVGRYHHASGKWHDVLPRWGLQGLDHVSVQLDEQGYPCNLMVDETKYGSSRLGVTSDGRQMSPKYVSKRLTGLSKAYGRVLAQAQNGAAIAKVPSGYQKTTILPVPLSDSERVAFWRPSKTAGPWFYDGSAELFPRALAQLQRLSTFYQTCADGRITFPTRIFRIQPGEGRTFGVTILDAETLEVKTKKIVADLDQPEWRAVLLNSVAKHIAAQNPTWSQRDVETLAGRMIKQAKSLDNLISHVPFRQFAARESFKAGGMGVLATLPLELAGQIFTGGPVDWSRVVGISGLAGGSAAAGSLLGNETTSVLLKTGLGYSASSAAAEILGMRAASDFANFTGATIGGGATAIFFAYGGYWLGYYDIQGATRSAIAGVAGAGAGAAATGATLWLVSTYATAGTGVAIASLSGAPATSATMAWLGGGSLASGGFGVSGGAVVLGTGVGVVVLGVTAAVLYGYHLADEHNESIRLTKTIDYLASKPTYFIPDSQLSLPK